MASQAALQERLAAVQQWDDDESDGGADEEEILALPAATVTTSSKRKRGKAAAAAAAAAAMDEMSSVLYIGHIPHGFYEAQMRGFFSQFGDVSHARAPSTRCRLGHRFHKPAS